MNYLSVPKYAALLCVESRTGYVDQKYGHWMGTQRNPSEQRLVIIYFITFQHKNHWNLIDLKSKPRTNTNSNIRALFPPTRIAIGFYVEGCARTIPSQTWGCARRRGQSYLIPGFKRVVVYHWSTTQSRRRISGLTRTRALSVSYKHWIESITYS